MTNLVSKSTADEFLAQLEADLRGVVQDEVAALRKSAALAKGDEDEDKEPVAEEASPEQPAGDVDAEEEGAGEPAGEAPEGGAPDEALDEGQAPVDEAPPAAEGVEGAPAGEPGMEGAPAPEGMEGAPVEGAEPGVAGDPAAEAAAGQPPASPEELQAEYAKLTPDELRMHYLAAKQALFALMGGAEGAPPAAPDMGAEAGAPPAPEAAAAAPAPAAPDASMAPPAPAPEAAPEEEQPAMKSEDDETSLVKAELETVKAQMAEMEAVILKMARTPVRKSVIATDYVGKPTETPAVEVPNLTKKEVFDRLAPRMSELSKSDRQLVNQFAFGNVAITEIAHLLKR